MFLLKTLNGAEMAPAKVFRKEPPSPSTNKFEVSNFMLLLSFKLQCVLISLIIK
jgi:hypothetical protein